MSERIEYACEVAPDEYGELTEVRGLHEPIVRCRDCKHCETVLYKTLDNTDIADCRCTLHFTIDEEPSEVHPNGFCAWGEKR